MALRTRRSLAPSSTAPIPGVRDVYPTAFAVAKADTEPADPRDPLSRESYESQALRCVACGAFHENHASYNACWQCGSDNFRGEVI